MTKELFKPAQYLMKNGTMHVLPGFFVSNQGRLVLPNGTITEGKMLATNNPKAPRNAPYLYWSGDVKLEDGSKKNFQLYLHRVVLSTFDDIGGVANLAVDHKDKNVHNNSLENLNWTSYKRNGPNGSGGMTLAELAA